MKKSNKILMIALTILSASANAEVYEVKEIESDLIGSRVKINEPIAYISGLGYCNSLKKEIALNTSCLVTKEADFKLTGLKNNCHNCVDKKRMVTPRKLHYKESTVFNVIAAYSSTHVDKMYKLMNSPINYLVLEDKEMNKIEIVDIKYELINENLNKLREEKGLISDYNNFKNTNFLVKTFCYYDEIASPDVQFDNAINIIKDFNLNIKIEEYDHCRINKSKKGVNLIIKNYNDYLTFDYYKNEWGLYGKWY